MNDLRKEFKLSMHPTALLFILLSAMLMIPNYPYYVIYFYTSLGIFFICLSGRENHDIFYSLTLPQSRRNIVKSRMSTAVILELMQTAAAIPFAVLRCKLIKSGNLVGMDANPAFFGFAFILLGIFNLVFFTNYYKAPEKVGKCFAVSAVAEGIFMILAETSVHTIPFFRDVLDTQSGYFIPKILTLAVGSVLFVILTFIAYKLSVERFENIDL